MLTAIIIVARVQPGTSKGITDLLLPQPSSVLKVVSGPSSLQKLRAEKCKSKDLQILMFIKKGGNKRLRSRSLPSGLFLYRATDTRGCRATDRS